MIKEPSQDADMNLSPRIATAATEAVWPRARRDAPVLESQRRTRPSAYPATRQSPWDERARRGGAWAGEAAGEATGEVRS